MATCPSCRVRYSDDVHACPADGERTLPDAAFSNADAPLPVGFAVGEYLIEGKLGEGGFGVVYRAAHPLIGKLAAIKVLNRAYSSNPEMVARFIAEARAVNQVRHRNIIDIFSFGSLEDGRQYYVMELLEGMPLDQYLSRRGRLPPEEALPILRIVGQALDAAHHHGIAHRDLKPENVFLEEDNDGNLLPKLLDFGIAKLMADSTAGAKTRTGAAMGTPYYMSPEQCRGKRVDHRTDIYSFGVMVYELLTGKLPFEHEDVLEVLFKQVNQTATPPSQVCPELPARLDAPILHMLAKDPDARPQSVAQAVDALTQAAAGAGISLRSGPISAGQLARVAKMTPAEIQSLGAEPTVLVDGQPARTLQGATTEVGTGAGRRRLFLVGSGLAVAAVSGVLAIWLLGKSSDDGAATAALPVTSVAATTASVAAPPKAASASPAASEIEVEILSVPAGTEVLAGDRSLGTAPGTVRLARGTGAVKLILRAAGFRDYELEVKPDKDRSIIVPPLTKAEGQPARVQKPAPIPSKKADRSELEAPEF